VAALGDPTLKALAASGSIYGEGLHTLGRTSRLTARIRNFGLGFDLDALGAAITADDAGAMRAALTQGTTGFDRGQVDLVLGDRVSVVRLVGGGSAGQIRLDIADGTVRLEARPATAPGRVVELSWAEGAAPADGVLTLDRRALAR
jgi:hypothetical protein